MSLANNSKCDQKPKSKENTDTTNLSGDIKIYEDLCEVSYYQSQSSHEGSIPRKYIINKLESIETSEVLSNEAVCDEEMSTFEDSISSRAFKDPDEDFKSISDNISLTDCGEPLTTQYLRLDFTPITGVDDDKFNENKCLNFWKFIDSHPELKPLKAEPDLKDLDESDSFISPSTLSTTLSTGSSGNDNKYGLEPVTVLTVNWLTREDVMTDSLVTKQAREIRCEPSLAQYDGYRERRQDNWPIIGPTSHTHKPLESKSTSVRSFSSVPVCMDQKRVSEHITATGKQDNLGQMMAEMHKWDSKHPKSLKPPGTIPGGRETNRNRRFLPFIDIEDDKYCEKCLN